MSYPRAWWQQLLAGWGGRAALAGAAAAIVAVAITLSVMGPGGGTDLAPAYSVEELSVSAMRGGPERPASPTRAVDVSGSDSVVAFVLRPATAPPAGSVLSARGFVGPPAGTQLAVASFLRLDVATDGTIAGRIQAGATLTAGPGTYVLWIAAGPAGNLPALDAILADDRRTAETVLLEGDDARRWSLQRVEIRYVPGP